MERTNSSSKIVHMPPLPEGDMTRRMPDITKMKRILGRDLISVKEGIDMLFQARGLKEDKQDYIATIP
jgi:UDP-glucose 4-epimerase